MQYKLMETHSDHSNAIQIALQYHQWGDKVRASALYQQILSEDPHHSQALYLSGVLAHDTGELQQAKVFLAQSISLEPDNALYHYEYGSVLMTNKEYVEATLYMKQALRLDETLLSAYVDLGVLLFSNRHYREALKINLKGLKRYPNDIDLLNNTAYIYKKNAKFKKAQALYEHLIALEPNHAQALFQLGNVYEEQEGWEAAIEVYEKSLALGNQPFEIFRGLGICLMRIGNLKIAEQYLLKAIQMDLECEKSKENYLALQNLLSYQPASLLPRKIRENPIDSPLEPLCEIVMFSPTKLLEAGGGQQPTQIARSLEERGHQILFIHHSVGDTLKPEDEKNNEYFSVYNDYFHYQNSPPTTFQYQQFQKILTDFQAQSRSKIGCDNRTRKIALFLISSAYLVGLIPLLREQGYEIVYWCIDDWQRLNRLLKAEPEKALMQQADYLLATSQDLRDKVENITGRTCPIVSNGFGRKDFKLATHSIPKPKDLHLGKEKTFIYWGVLGTWWMNWDLIDEVAQRHPEWSFNFIGVLSAPGKLKHSNVHYLGLKKVSELQGYGVHSNIGIIHFQDNPLVQAFNPVKAYEYLASGIPVISTPMRELDTFPYTLQIRTAQEFENAVEQVSQWELNFALIEEFLQERSWEQRAKSFLEVIQELPQ